MKNELTYHREGDYLIPDLIPPESPKIGVWGMRRRDYLKKYHDGIYTGMLFSGKLNAHLEEIDRSANEMFDLLPSPSRTTPEAASPSAVSGTISTRSAVPIP